MLSVLISVHTYVKYETHIHRFKGGRRKLCKVMEIFMALMVMLLQVYTYPQMHWVVNFKYVQLFTYQLYTSIKGFKIFLLIFNLKAWCFWWIWLSGLLYSSIYILKSWKHVELNVSFSIKRKKSHRKW